MRYKDGDQASEKNYPLLLCYNKQGRSFINVSEYPNFSMTFTAISVAIVLFGWLESMADSPGVGILNFHMKKTNLFLWVVELYGTKNISESDSGSISDGYLFVER
jgi:hypothetical protein